MASSESSVTEEVRIVRTRRYRWPAVQLNFWLLIMLIASATIVGIFAWFMTVQQQLQLGIPWQFPYWVTVGGISILFILIMLYLISQRSLLPGVVILGSFILFVLFLVGLIVTSIELWGPTGNVNGNCNLYVSDQQSFGQSINTLAWLEQSSICQSWKAAFSFELIGTVFLLWMMIMSYQVYRDDI